MEEEPAPAPAAAQAGGPEQLLPGLLLSLSQELCVAMETGGWGTHHLLVPPPWEELPAAPAAAPSPGGTPSLPPKPLGPNWAISWS